MSEQLRVPAIAAGSVPELVDLEAVVRDRRGGEVPVLYQVLFNSPSIASGWEQLLTAVRSRTTVPANLRELVILRVAVLNQASFEFAAHEPHARAAGVDVAKIAAVRDAHLDETAFALDELLVLTVTDHMTTEIEVPEELIVSLRETFGDQGTVEVVATVAAYNMVSRFLVALNIVHHASDEEGAHA